MKLENGIYAKIKTIKGDIIARLEYEKTPLTVANFVGLAEGSIKHNRSESERFYDNLIFHRVIANFMIQGGCPQGTGTGDPGYKFADEFHPDLRHDAPGIFSMANSGPDSNGSQFFITHGPTPWLDNKHNVFGKVVDEKSMNVVSNIDQEDKIKAIEIIRVGEKVKDYNVTDEFFNKLKNERESLGESLAERENLKKSLLSREKVRKQTRD